METIKYADLHHQAQYTIMKVLRNDAPGGMKSIDKQAGGTVKGFNGSDINSPLGEFWFARDGITPHQNDKALLPVGGKYVEYTVSDMAPNAKGKVESGGKRLIHRTNGSGKEFFYTEDHYTSFRKVIWIPTADCEKYGPGF